MSWSPIKACGEKDKDVPDETDVAGLTPLCGLPP